MIGTIVLAAYCGLLALAALADLAWLRIPNILPLLILILFTVAGAVAAQPAGFWVSHLGTGAIVLVAGMALFAWGKIGGGDAKLLAAAALWSGWVLLPAFLLTVGVIGGVVAGLCLILRRMGVALVLTRYGFPAASLEDGKGIPYGVAIVGGSLLQLPHLPVP